MTNARPRTIGSILAVALAVTLLATTAIVPTASAATEGVDYAFFNDQAGEPWKWEPEPVAVKYWIHQDVIAAGYENAVRNAFQTWEDDSGSNVSFDYRGSTSTLSDIRLAGGNYSLPTDGKNVVSFNELGGVLGRGGFRKIGTFDGHNWTYQTEFDISITNNHSTYIADGSVPAKVDMETVILHEVGHVLGLDHPQTAGLLMSASLATNSTMRNLGAGERQGIAALYPQSAEPTPTPTGPLCDGKAVTINMNTGASGNGTVGDDVILGTDGSDRIKGFGGNDTICGGAGIDHIYGGDGNDRLMGDGGSDRIRAGLGHDVVYGGSGSDRIWGSDGNDQVFGQGGQDQIHGEDGHDIIEGNHQSDTLEGGAGDDVLRGAGGKDEIRGEGGDDLLYGGDNSDELYGGVGSDYLHGQNGRDQCVDRSGLSVTTVVSC